jgi:predicted enzyme related to lactoylglutathione lyase
MKPRTIHFEVPAKDPSKLAAFYRSTFGWQVDTWGGSLDSWSVVMGSEGILVTDRAALQPRGIACLANTVEVDDLDRYILKIKTVGGTVELEKQTVMGRGYFAYCADVEGNVFALWQTDPFAGNDSALTHQSQEHTS